MMTTLIGIYSGALSSEPEEALRAAGIPFGKQYGESEAGTDEVRFFVAEEDAARASATLEQLEKDLNTDLDLRDLVACPWCQTQGPMWFLRETESGTVEMLICSCSDNGPVAIRDPKTKRGWLLDRPT